MLVSMAKAAVADAFAQRKIEGWTLHVQDEEWILQRVQGPLLQVYPSQCSTSTRQHYSGWRLDHIYNTSQQGDNLARIHFQLVYCCSRRDNNLSWLFACRTVGCLQPGKSLLIYELSRQSLDGRGFELGKRLGFSSKIPICSKFVPLAQISLIRWLPPFTHLWWHHSSVDLTGQRIGTDQCTVQCSVFPRKLPIKCNNAPREGISTQ